MNKKKQIDLVVIGVGFPDIIQTIEDINSNNQSVNFLGFLDDNKDLLDKNYYGYKIIGGLDWIEKNPDTYIFNTVARNLSVRSEVNSYFKKRNIKFANLIHPTVSTKYSVLGDGILLSKNVYLEPRSTIGSNTMILQGSSIGHDCIVGNNCFIGPGSNILGNVAIEEDCFIGSGSTVYPGIVIKKKSTTGMNSIIMKGVNENETISSPPSRKIFLK